MSYKIALCFGAILLSCVWSAACVPQQRVDGQRRNVARLEFALNDNMPVTSIAWSPDGKYIAASSTQGNKIHIWDVEERRRVHEFARAAAGHAFRELSWDPIGRYLAVCDGHRGQMRLYDAHTWVEARLLPQPNDLTCIASAFSSDGQEFAILGNSLTVYATDDWHLIRFLDLRKDVAHGIPFQFKALGYVPRTHIILLGGDDQELADSNFHPTGHIWVLNPNENIPGREFEAYKFEPPGAPPQLISLAISPDGESVAAGTKTGASAEPLGPVTAAVHILSLSNGALLGAPLDGQHVDYQEGLSFTPDGRYLIVAHGGFNTSHDIHVIDAKTLRVIDVVHAGSTVYGLAVSPDSKRFAVCAGGSVWIWSLASNS
jgi:WD40 repeat protein